LKALCEQPEQAAKLERAFAAVTGQPVRIEFTIVGGAAEAEPPKRAASPRARLVEKAQHPMVRRAEELFGARIVSVEEA
jgi:hypothetical protein